MDALERIGFGRRMRDIAHTGRLRPLVKQPQHLCHGVFLTADGALNVGTPNR